jgi:hypothetical protein
MISYPLILALWFGIGPVPRYMVCSHNCASIKHGNLEDQIIYTSMNSQYFPGANNY